MEARVLDEKRPKIAGVIVCGLVGASLMASITIANDLVSGMKPFLAAFASLLAFGFPFAPRARGYQRAKLDVRPGIVRITGRRARLPLRITSRDVVGATTAALPNGRIGLVLSLSGRLYDPLVLEVASEKEAGEVRRALGLGHGGVGAVGFPAKLPTTRVAGLVLHAVALLSTLTLAASMFVEVGTGAAVLAVMGIIAGVFVGFPLYVGGGTGEVAALQADGVHVYGVTRYRQIVWSSIREVIRADRALDLVLVTGEVVRVVPASALGPSKGVLDAFQATLEDAVRRANGLAAPKEHGAESVLTLARAPHERRGDWLARLDAVGRTLSVGAGYRGGAFDEQDLWKVMEDPDADPELRIAAGRALSAARRGPEVKQRIDDAVAASARDGYFEQRIRIAIDTPDVERAGAKLDELEVVTEGAAIRRQLRAM